MSEFSESLSLVGVVYALAFVIAMGAALLIKLIVGALAFSERHAEAKAAAASAAAAPAARPVAAPAAAEGIPPHHLVAIAVAAHAMVGAHRILHIGAAASGRYWSTEGRLAQHNAHHPH